MTVPKSVDERPEKLIPVGCGSDPGVDSKKNRSRPIYLTDSPTKNGTVTSNEVMGCRSDEVTKRCWLRKAAACDLASLCIVYLRMNCELGSSAIRFPQDQMAGIPNS